MEPVRNWRIEVWMCDWWEPPHDRHGKYKNVAGKFFEAAAGKSRCYYKVVSCHVHLSIEIQVERKPFVVW